MDSERQRPLSYFSSASNVPSFDGGLVVANYIGNVGHSVSKLNGVTGQPDFVYTEPSLRYWFPNADASLKAAHASKSARETA